MMKPMLSDNKLRLVDDNIAENAVTMEVDVENRAVTSTLVTTGAALDDTTRKPTSRKSRFAALAQNINSYEDDLSHHSFE